MTLPLNVLAVSANAGNVGMVVLINSELKYWQNSRKASKSEEDATIFAERWIHQFQPHLVVTEKLPETTRKSSHTQSVIAAFAKTAAAQGVISLSLARVKRYKNKYQEAVALAERYPTIKPWVPTRKFYDPEPKNVVLFEALALAELAQHNQATRIASALG